MKRTHIVLFGLLFGSMVGIRSLSAQDSIPTKFITFEDMRPPEVPCFSMGYGTLGLDTDDNVYVAWCGDCGAPGNCAMFRYNPATGDRKLLGTLREVAKDAGNLGPNQYWTKSESFMKGHTALPYLKGKIYMGTQEFHAVSNALNRATNATNYRGAHIFAYDIAKGKLEDVSVSQPNGVFSPHQGILQLTAYPEKNLLIGWAIPAGDLIFYDVDAGTSYAKPGIPSEFGKDVTREIPVTSKGKVLYNYQGGGLYLYDIAAKTDTKLDFSLNYGGCAGDMQGVLNGAVVPKDRKKIYFATYGYLYVLDSETEKITFLTKQLPSTETLNICRVWGMALSLDEKKIYWVVTTGSAALRLYEYDIASNQVVFLKDLNYLIGKSQTYSGKPGQLSEVSGDNVTDSKGRIYFVRHTYDATGGSGLLQIDVRSRLPPTVTNTSTVTSTGTGTFVGTEPRGDAGIVNGTDANAVLADALAADVAMGTRDTAMVMSKSDASAITTLADAAPIVTDPTAGKKDSGAPNGGVDKPGSSGCGCTLGKANPNGLWGVCLAIVALFGLGGRSRRRP